MRRSHLVLAAVLFVSGIVFGQTAIGNIFRIFRQDESAFPTPSTVNRGGLLYGTDAGVLYVSNGTAWVASSYQPAAANGVAGIVNTTTQDFSGLKSMLDGLSVGSSSTGTFQSQYTSSFGPPGDQIITATFNPGNSSAGGTSISLTSIDATSPPQAEPGLVALCDGSLAGSTAILASGGGNFGIGITAVGSPEGAAGDFTAAGVGTLALDAPAVHARGVSLSVPVQCDPSSTGAALRLTPRIGAPSQLAEGDMWLQTDGGLYYYLSGTSHLVTAVPP